MKIFGENEVVHKEFSDAFCVLKSLSWMFLFCHDFMCNLFFFGGGPSVVVAKKEGKYINLLYVLILQQLQRVYFGCSSPRKKPCHFWGAIRKKSSRKCYQRNGSSSKLPRPSRLLNSKPLNPETIKTCCKPRAPGK